MTYDELWGVSSHFYWLMALSLPVLPWAKPFLAILGLPDALLEHPQIWESIYIQAVQEEKTRLQTENWHPDSRGELTRQVVIKALQELADQMGRDVAIDLERWVRRHFFRHDIELALGDWNLLLILACRPANSHRQQIPPPAVLQPILPEIASLVSSVRSIELMIEVRKVAPPPAYEMSPNEKLDKCYEATMLSRAANQALVIKALQTIASLLNEIERKEVLAWAQIQAEAVKGMVNPERLCGDKYLRVEPPGFDMPSILDLTAPEENRFGDN